MAVFNDIYPRTGSPLSLAEIRRITGAKSALFKYLRYSAVRDVVYFKDDFTDDTLNTFWSAVANGGGAGAASPVISVAANGYINFTTGTAADNTAASSIISSAIWKGDQNAGMEFRFKTDPTNVTEFRFEGGFVDVVPGSSKSVVNSLVTPTVNTSVVDAAVFVVDNASAVTTAGLYTIGTAISAAKQAITLPVTLAAATHYTVRIQLVTNQVYCWVNGELLGQAATGSTDYVEGGSALALWFRAGASNSTSKVPLLDYVHAWADRA